ncbi:MAG: hypothetical protein M1838_000721 [Thelocarpon superellum]|nr:MAG: hypothetical protein M1838_000721 [Thelocarpon superellum]
MSHSHNDHSHSHSHGHGNDHDHDHDHSDDQPPVLQSHIYGAIAFSEISTLNESVPGAGAAVVQKPFINHLDPEPVLLSSSSHHHDGVGGDEYSSSSSSSSSSDDDDGDEGGEHQLLMTVPFSGSVKLHSLLIRASDHPSAPRTVHLYSNRENLDFATVGSGGGGGGGGGGQGLQPTQTLHLPRSNALLDLPLRRALWTSTRCVGLFFADNHSGSAPSSLASSASATSSHHHHSHHHHHQQSHPEERAESTRIYYLGFRGTVTTLNAEPVSFLYEAAANPADHALDFAAVGARGGVLGSGNAGGKWR